jgi:hypothetical protein
MSESELLSIFTRALDLSLSKIVDTLELRELQRMYPKKIKGTTQAAELLGITPNALRLRVFKAIYLPNIHYKKISDRILVWDRDALLQERFNNETIQA